MRPIHRYFAFLPLLILLSTQGCLAAAVGYTGYALSSSKEEAAKKDAEAKNVQSYNTYKADADQLNFEREKTGLKPQPVMTFPEWKLAHNIPTPAPEPIKQEKSQDEAKNE